MNMARMLDVGGGVLIALIIAGLFQAGVRELGTGRATASRGRTALGLGELALAILAGLWLIFLRYAR